MSLGSQSTQNVHTPKTGRQLASTVAGVASNYKIARGNGTLDGTNPTTVATGLANVIAFFLQLKGSSAPGDNTSVLTGVKSSTAGSIDVYAWKNTSGNDPTLVASTGTEDFDWFAIGY